MTESLSYFKTPNFCVAVNTKAGSTSMAHAIIQEFYPKLNSILKYERPYGTSLHWFCPSTQSPDKPIVLLVRDPVSRFLSACQQADIQSHDLNSAILSLINDTSFVRTKLSDSNQQVVASDIPSKRRVKSPHKLNKLRQDMYFFHQHKYAIGPTICFRFPRDFSAAMQFIGIESEAPETNKAKKDKPVLTIDQEKAIKLYYKLDQDLFNLIINPGYLLVS
jgi:hypothetical protein